MLCERLGIDIWEVVDAASTKPFGFMRFEPGPGMGGHCLPVDPFYLAFKAREHDLPTEFVELAGKINQQQPRYCVERIARALNDAGLPVNGSSSVLLLGVAYKGGVADMREAPALKIAAWADRAQGDLSYSDPHVTELAELGLRSRPLDEALADCDIACIITAHPGIDYQRVAELAPRTYSTSAASSRRPRGRRPALAVLRAGRAAAAGPWRAGGDDWAVRMRSPQDAMRPRRPSNRRSCGGGALRRPAPFSAASSLRLARRRVPRQRGGARAPPASGSAASHAILRHGHGDAGHVRRRPRRL